MLKFLQKLNTNLNLFQALAKKAKTLIKFIKQKKLLSVFILLLLAAVSFFGYRQLRPQPLSATYELGQVNRQDITQTVSASGVIASQTQVDLKFQTSGMLSWVGVKQGDLVKKWQAIASLDQQALKKTMEKYLRDYSKERNDFDQDHLETYKDKILTDTIKRILEKNQWDLEKAVLDVELQNISLKYASLISPIDGLVTHIDTPVAGVNITPATAVFTVADPTHLEFKAQIDEADIGLIAPGQPAQLILDAYPDDPLNLMVDSINFNSSTDSSGSTVYLVKFLLTNPDLNRYRLGMNGEVTITVSQKTNVLTVPSQAIIENNQTFVQIVDQNKVIEQPVTTGLIGEDDIEILSGLVENQTIVIAKKSKK